MEKSSYNIAMTSLDHVKLSTKDVIFKDWWTSDVSVAYVPTIANTITNPFGIIAYTTIRAASYDTNILCGLQDVQ